MEEKQRFVVGNVTVTDNNDYVSYSSIDFTVMLDAIRDKLIKTHGGLLRVRYSGGVSMSIKEPIIDKKWADFTYAQKNHELYVR